MTSPISTASAFSLLLALVSGASALNAGEAQGDAGCDSTRNRETWSLKHRDCGSNPGQTALLANVSKPPVAGGQYSLVLNVAVEEVKGTQAALGVNYAKRAHNQIAYHVNLAGTVDGFQLSTLNIADSVKGSQFGFVNASRNLDGLSLAFLTLAGNGLFHLDASAEETGMSTLGFASGKGFFTSYSLGYTVAEASHPYAFGMGFGYHQAFGGRYLEGELRGHLVVDRHTDVDDFEDRRDRGDSDWRHNTLLQAKLRAGARLFGLVGAFAGVSFNALDTHGNPRLMGPWTDEATASSEDLFTWPGVEIGIRLGR